MRSDYKLFAAFGIDIKLHISFLLLLPLLALSMAADIGGDIAAFLYSLLIFMALFASVLMHELCHSLVAIREGVKVSQITLTPIGGIASMGNVRDSGKEFLISVVGPLSNFVLAAILLIGLVGFVGQEVLLDIILSGDAFLSPSPLNFAIVLLYLNLILGLFNLFLPIFPMDGGRVLRAMLGMVTTRLRATKIAVAIGQGFLAVLIVFSLLSGNLWLVLIGIFLFFAGVSELKFTELSESTKDLDLEKMIRRDIIMLEEGMPVKEFFSISAPWQGLYPVADKEDRILGVFIPERVSSKEGTVGEAAEKDYPSARLKDSKEETVVKIYSKGYVLMLDEDGKLLGVITVGDLKKASQ